MAEFTFDGQMRPIMAVSMTTSPRIGGRLIFLEVIDYFPRAYIFTITTYRMPNTLYMRRAPAEYYLPQFQGTGTIGASYRLLPILLGFSGLQAWPYFGDGFIFHLAPASQPAGSTIRSRARRQRGLMRERHRRFDDTDSLIS